MKKKKAQKKQNTVTQSEMPSVDETTAKPDAQKGGESATIQDETCSQQIEQSTAVGVSERADVEQVQNEQVSEQNETHSSGTGYTQQEVERIVDEIVATPKPTRIWEVDLLRGVMILFVVWDHLMWDIANFGPYSSKFFNALETFAISYQGGALRDATHDTFVTLFVFTSGVSCSFSRSNGRRALKMIAFALLFTAVTFAASSILDVDITIHFNVIHVIALSVLLWTLIEYAWGKCEKRWQKNVFGGVMLAVVIAALVVGATANVQGWQNKNPMWFFLAMHDNSVPGFYEFWGGDYLPFLPDFGWFLIGAFLGRFLYKEKKSLFPSVNPKWVCPFTFCGRYSIWIYFGSQVFFAGLLFLLSQVIKCI